MRDRATAISYAGVQGRARLTVLNIPLHTTQDRKARHVIHIDMVQWVSLTNKVCKVLMFANFLLASEHVLIYAKISNKFC